jgi:MFS family permease
MPPPEPGAAAAEPISRASLNQASQDGGSLNPNGAVFGAPFWFTYAANTSMMVAVSLLYRYADFIFSVGGDELQLGLIVGTGMVGSVVFRLIQGVGIDTYGPRQIWLWSCALFVLSCLAHLTISSAQGPAIFLVRVLFQTSISGFFGASITYISGRAPIAHMAEVIGTLGTSGFIGTMLGTKLGDVLWPYGPACVFLGSAAIGSGAFFFGLMATRGQSRRTKRGQPPRVWIALLRRYHPGAVMLTGVAAGFGLGLPTVFLQPFVETLGIAGIAPFFWVYSPIALVSRLCIRRLPEQIGIRPMILLGIGSLVAAMLSFLVVTTQWHLVLPAVLLGLAHAILFPSIVAGGSGVFPLRLRGLGTTVMLAMFDVGNLVGSPTIGGILYYSARMGLNEFSTMFLCVAVLLGLTGLVYALKSGGVQDRRRLPRHVRRDRAPLNSANVGADNSTRMDRQQGRVAIFPLKDLPGDGSAAAEIPMR